PTIAVVSEDDVPPPSAEPPKATPPPSLTVATRLTTPQEEELAHFATEIEGGGWVGTLGGERDLISRLNQSVAYSALQRPNLLTADEDRLRSEYASYLDAR